MLSIFDTLPESVPSFGPNPTLTLQNHFSSWFDYLMPTTDASFTFILNRNSGAFSITTARGGPHPSSSTPTRVLEVNVTSSTPGPHSWTFKQEMLPSGRPPGQICPHKSLPISRDLLCDVPFFPSVGLSHFPIYFWHDPSISLPTPTHGRGDCVPFSSLFPDIIPLRRDCNRINLFRGMFPFGFRWITTELAATVSPMNIYPAPSKFCSQGIFLPLQPTSNDTPSAVSTATEQQTGSSIDNE